MSPSQTMKISLSWKMSGLMLGCCLLSACGSQSGTPTAAVNNVANANVPANEPPLVVPGPDGKARVLVTATKIMLQRLPDGPLEELDEPMDADEMRYAEKMQALAQSVRWSPGGKRVCFEREYKRGSGVAVFTLAAQPAAEVGLELDGLQEEVQGRYESEFRLGRFYYITLGRWIDEDHLEIKFSGNLVPKEGDDGEHWKCYQGSVRVELGAKNGTVQGKPTLRPLTKEMDEPTTKAVPPGSGSEQKMDRSPRLRINRRVPAIAHAHLPGDASAGQ